MTNFVPESKKEIKLIGFQKAVATQNDVAKYLSVDCCTNLSTAKVRLFPRLCAKVSKKLMNINTMQERVTRNDLRNMRIGQTRIFTLADKKKITSARVQANQLKQEEDLEFDVKPDFEASAVSITRIK